MKNLNYVAPKMPTANIAVNKSRVKLYNKKGDMPTYYLQKGQEFQIELFNPTTEPILAKITLNGNTISQGGLILSPGQRVFLERYLDVAKKFMFDTYEVSNTQEVREAIANNGDFKVQFYRESKPRPRNPIVTLGGINKSRTVFGGPDYNQGIFDYNNIINTGGYVYNSTTPINTTFTTNSDISFVAGSLSNTSVYDSSVSYSNNTNEVTLDRLSTKKSKTLETGRVEEGSDSDQKFKTVEKSFESFSFYTVEAKLLPVSQKINTAEDIKVKVYCTNCGA